MSETATVYGVEISSPDKAIWPNASGDEPVTKRELAEYFEAAASAILPHIEGRPCSIVRAPGGIKGDVFFQRHPGKGAPEAFDEVRLDQDHEPYLVLNGARALVALAQIGGIELHPTGGAPNEPDQPDRLVFDLDPGPGTTFDEVVDAAQAVRTRLEAHGLAAFCRTTGGKGLHVVTPIQAGSANWKDAKKFARTLCEKMADDAPEQYVTQSAKALREGRIFLDYLRNDRLNTAIAPLSPRARPGALVAMPLNWDQVSKDLDPNHFTLRNALEQLARSKAWRGYEAARKLLPK